MIYDALRNKTFKTCLEQDIQEELLKVSFTTSKNAHSGELGEESDQKDQFGKPLCNKIRFL